MGYILFISSILDVDVFLVKAAVVRISNADHVSIDGRNVQTMFLHSADYDRGRVSVTIINRKLSPHDSGAFFRALFLCVPLGS